GLFEPWTKLLAEVVWARKVGRGCRKKARLGRVGVPAGVEKLAIHSLLDQSRQAEANDLILLNYRACEPQNLLHQLAMPLNRRILLRPRGGALRPQLGDDIVELEKAAGVGPHAGNE